MVEFDYLIHDSMGLHARPVGLVVKAVTPYKGTKITIWHGDKSADAKRMFAVMGLQVNCGETIRICGEGENEKEVADTVKGIFEAEKL